METSNLILIGIIAALLITGVAAYGLNDAGDSGDQTAIDHVDHSKNHKSKNHVKDKSSKEKSSSSSGKTEINLDVTMQQNVNNYLFNIPTTFIIDVDEYNENTFTYTKVFLPDNDEEDWEVDLEIIEFDEANGRNLTTEDVEDYAGDSATPTTINGIDGYYYQDGDWETFVFGSGNELITVSVYGISLEVVLNGVTQEPIVGDMEVEEETSEEDESMSDEENTDDSSFDDSSYDDSSYDDSYDDSSYDDSYDDEDSYYDDSYDDSSYDDSYEDDDY